MERTVQILMRCIRAEIFGEEPKRAFFSDVTPDEWGRVRKLADRHDLAHLVGDFVTKQGYVPDGTAGSDWKRPMLIAFRRYTAQSAELRAIRDVFERARIPFICLKGSALRARYPEAWMRTSADLDLLVRKDDLSHAASLLETELSYRNVKRGYHDQQMYAPGGVHLELHFSLREDGDPGLSRVLERAWDYTGPVSGACAESAFSPSFFAFYQIAHMAHHFYRGGCGIRPFLDLRMLPELQERDRAEFDALLSEAGITRFCECAMRLSDVWFADGRPDTVSRKMERYVLDGGAYGSYKNGTMAEQSRIGKRRSTRAFLFPSYSELCERYPDREIRKWQAPYYRLIRYRDALRHRGVRKGIRMLRCRVAGSGRDAEEVRRLMAELGLQTSARPDGESPKQS